MYHTGKSAYVKHHNRSKLYLQKDGSKEILDYTSGPVPALISGSNPHNNDKQLRVTAIVKRRGGETEENLDQNF